VSYNHKHNEANGENNRDGHNHNESWNCGVEGQTDDLQVNALRQRQIKNLAAILLLSQGVPMILMGDEVRRTQRGNNNAYCQDNEISWFNWEQVQENSEMLRFWREMIHYRRRFNALRRAHFFRGQVNERGLQDITWHGVELNRPGWGDPHARALAFTLASFDDAPDLHVILNMYWEELEFELPPVQGRQWYRVVDTHQASPLDILEPGQEILVMDNVYPAQGRSVVLLISR
jgi:glycogen operon protein